MTPQEIYLFTLIGNIGEFFHWIIFVSIIFILELIGMYFLGQYEKNNKKNEEEIKIYIKTQNKIINYIKICILIIIISVICSITIPNTNTLYLMKITPQLTQNLDNIPKTLNNIIIKYLEKNKEKKE